MTSTIRFLTRVLCRVDDAQLARVPDSGPLIIVINHVNFLEAPLLYTHLVPRPFTGYAKAETWDVPFKRELANLWGAIPLHRGEADVRAMRGGLEVLQADGILAIAPEGTRSGHGRLQQGRAGVVLLALHTGVPILPVVMYGHEPFWHNLTRLRRTAFHFVVGQPFQLDTLGTQVTRQLRQEMIGEVMYQMAALLPPAYRGIYADLAAATEKHLRFLPGAESNLRHAQA